MELSKERASELKNFLKKTGLKFKNLKLLNQAFCHTSYAYENKQDRNESYERLEFLGDAVLKLAISDFLYETFDKENEGRLTEKRGAIVSDKTIATFAEKIGVYDFVLTGKCEKDVGAKKESILACVFEAVLGAIYLESGYKKGKEFLIKNFKEEILNTDYFNPKARLQDFTQRASHKLPKYVLLEEKGPAHKKTFVVGVYYEGELIDKAEGSTKKEAEFEAAKKALIKLEKESGEKECQQP